MVYSVEVVYEVVVQWTVVVEEVTLTLLRRKEVQVYTRRWKEGQVMGMDCGIIETLRS